MMYSVSQQLKSKNLNHLIVQDYKASLLFKPLLIRAPSLEMYSNVEFNENKFSSIGAMLQ